MVDEALRFGGTVSGCLLWEVLRRQVGESADTGAGLSGCAVRGSLRGGARA